MKRNPPTPHRDMQHIQEHSTAASHILLSYAKYTLKSAIMLALGFSGR